MIGRISNIRENQVNKMKNKPNQDHFNKILLDDETKPKEFRKL